MHHILFVPTKSQFNLEILRTLRWDNPKCTKTLLSITKTSNICKFMSGRHQLAVKSTIYEQTTVKFPATATQLKLLARVNHMYLWAFVISQWKIGRIWSAYDKHLNIFKSLPWVIFVIFMLSTSGLLLKVICTNWLVGLFRWKMFEFPVISKWCIREWGLDILDIFHILLWAWVKEWVFYWLTP